jgi:hypothetical protein
MCARRSPRFLARVQRRPAHHEKLLADLNPAYFAEHTGAVMADWIDEQNDAVVADYFAMLADDIVGRPIARPSTTVCCRR